MFVDRNYSIIIYNNNLRFLTNIPYNTNVVDFADLGRSKSSSGAGGIVPLLTKQHHLNQDTESEAVKQGPRKHLVHCISFNDAIFPASKADNNKERKTWIGSCLFV